MHVIKLNCESKIEFNRIVPNLFGFGSILSTVCTIFTSHTYNVFLCYDYGRTSGEILKIPKKGIQLMIPHRWCAISGSCFRFIALHYVMLRYFTLRYVMLRYFTLLYVADANANAMYNVHTPFCSWRCDDGLFHSNWTPNIPHCDLSSASTFVRDQLVWRLIAAKLKLKFAANNELNSWCCPTPTSTSTPTSNLHDLKPLFEKLCFYFYRKFTIKHHTKQL